MFKDISLKQKNHEGKIEINVFSNKKLKISKKSILQNHEYQVDLSHIDPSPVSFKNVPKRPLTWAIVCVVFAMFFLIASVTKDISHPDKNPFMGMSVFLFIAAATLLSIVHRKYMDLYIFTNRSDGSNIFFISKNKPSTKEVSGFIEQLAKRIDSIRYSDEIPIKEKIEVYKKHLEFLLSEGVISESAFKESLSLIAKLHKKGSVLNIAQKV